MGVDVEFNLDVVDGFVLAVRLNGIDCCCVTNGFAEGSEVDVVGDLR